MYVKLKEVTSIIYKHSLWLQNLNLKSVRHGVIHWRHKREKEERGETELVMINWDQEGEEGFFSKISNVFTQS